MKRRCHLGLYALLGLLGMLVLSACGVDAEAQPPSEVQTRLLAFADEHKMEGEVASKTFTEDGEPPLTISTLTDEGKTLVAMDQAGSYDLYLVNHGPEDNPVLMLTEQTDPSSTRLLATNDDRVTPKSHDLFLGKLVLGKLLLGLKKAIFKKVIIVKGTQHCGWWVCSTQPSPKPPISQPSPSSCTCSSTNTSTNTSYSYHCTSSWDTQCSSCSSYGSLNCSCSSYTTTCSHEPSPEY